MFLATEVVPVFPLIMGPLALLLKAILQMLF